VAGADHDHVGNAYRSDGFRHGGLAVLCPTLLDRGRRSQSVPGAVCDGDSALVRRERSCARDPIMLSSLQISAIIGAPLAGWLIDVPVLNLQGWQALFILEAVPAIVLGLVVVYWLADWPATAWWLSADEKEFLTRQHEQESHAGANAGHYTWRRRWRIEKC